MKNMFTADPNCRHFKVLTLLSSTMLPNIFFSGPTFIYVAIARGSILATWNKSQGDTSTADVFPLAPPLPRPAYISAGKAGKAACNTLGP
jgi:hypothetical protein